MLGGAGVEVTTRDVLVYPEVWLGDLGWRPFYPVPVPGASTDQEIVQGLGAQPDDIDLTDVTPQPGAATEDPDDPPELAESDAPLGLWEGVAIAGATLVGALLLWVLGVLVVTTLRRRRRRTSGSPRDRVLAAWREVQDGLALGGGPAGADDDRGAGRRRRVRAGGGAGGRAARGRQRRRHARPVRPRRRRAGGRRPGVAGGRRWSRPQVRRHRGWKGRLVDLLAPGR